MQTIQFTAKFEYLDEIRDFVGNTARTGGFSDKDIYNIQLAADEAASNIIEHAYDGVSDGILEVSCGLKDGAITIVLVDHGELFRPVRGSHSEFESRPVGKEDRGTGFVSHAKING